MTRSLSRKAQIAAIVAALWSAGERSDGAMLARPAPKLRAALAGAPCVPVGDGDAKTAAPGTYRPVGRTCPASCPFGGNGCYAEGGNVALHQRRADESSVAALNGAALAMVWAARTGRLARLHVSGDFGRIPQPEYLSGLCVTADEVNRRAGRPVGTPVAWTYTHHRVRPETPWIQRLLSHGVVVRVSDHCGPGGAIVAPFDSVRSLRQRTGQRIAKCSAQLSDKTCATCRLCWERMDLVIAFDPHGGRKGRAAEVSPALG